MLIQNYINIGNTSKFNTFYRVGSQQYTNEYIRSFSTSHYLCTRKYRSDNLPRNLKNRDIINYVSKLNAIERRNFDSIIIKLNKKVKISNKSLPKPAEVNNEILYKVFLFNCMPFIGFGALDNMLMIVAGEYIDMTLGAAIGISTMAAAALGNLLSDVVGVGSTSYIESLCFKLGLMPPHLTPPQIMFYKTRFSVAMGRVVGLTIGCLIGMFPLLFYSEKKDKVDDHTCSSEQ